MKKWTNEEYRKAEIELAGYEGWQFENDGEGIIRDPFGVHHMDPPAYCRDILVAGLLIERYQLTMDGDDYTICVHWPDAVQGQAHDVDEHPSREVAMCFALTQAAIAYHKQCLEKINENGNGGP